MTPWTVQSILQARILFPSPGYLPNPGIEPRSPTLQVDYLPAESKGKPRYVLRCIYFASDVIFSQFLSKCITEKIAKMWKGSFFKTVYLLNHCLKSMSMTIE